MNRISVSANTTLPTTMTAEEFRRVTGNMTQPELVKEAAHETKADAKAEKILQVQCENYLRLNDIEFLHLSSRAREKEGWPDLVFCLRGIPWAVELKTATGTVSEEQSRVLTNMTHNGWTVRVIRSFMEFRKIVMAGLPKSEVKA